VVLVGNGLSGGPAPASWAGGGEVGILDAELVEMMSVREAAGLQIDTRDCLTGHVGASPCWPGRDF
jgi:hypothetical protein